PPIHGAALMNDIVVKSRRIADVFQCHVCNLTPPQEFERIGKIEVVKIVWTVRQIIRIIRYALTIRARLAYYAFVPTGVAFYRDAILGICLRWLGVECLYHLHGKGITAQIERGLWRSWLCQLAFRGTNVITLSERL